jgi:hypothetical protein
MLDLLAWEVVSSNSNRKQAVVSSEHHVVCVRVCTCVCVVFCAPRVVCFVPCAVSCVMHVCEGCCESCIMSFVHALERRPSVCIVDEGRWNMACCEYDVRQTERQMCS